MTDVKSEGPLRHFRVGRRTVLQSLATGVGAAMFASSAAAEHVHVASTAPMADDAAANTANAGLQFLDRHAFDTLALLSEQIVPGSRAAGVAEFLDRLLAVESTNGAPWKSLSADQATALLTKISTQPNSDPSRHAFDRIKGAVAETYYQTEIGMKELGWNGSVAFVATDLCQPS